MSAIDRQQAVVSAILAALGNDAALSAAVGQRIYDAPPARAVMPSIVLRVVSALDASTADTEAQLLTFDLDVWDRYELGSTLSRPRLVMAHIRRILHMQPLTAAGAPIVALRCTASRGPVRDPDELALHGVVTLVALGGHDTVSP